MRSRRLMAFAAVGAAALTGATTTSACGMQDGDVRADEPPATREALARTPDAGTDTLAHAIFAGGCFWCVEEAFDKADGVTATTSGYTGGDVRNPTYEQVSAGGTGHVEAVRVTFDPRRIGYAELLDVFWHNVDPTDAGGQFCDRGSQYVSAIYYLNGRQERLARESKRALEAAARLEEPIVTEILPAKAFYPAEAYHQNYYEKNPIRYRFYKFTCGRARTLDDIWGEQAGLS